MKKEIQKAQEVYKALITLAEFLGETENSIASKVTFFDDKKFKKIKDAVSLVNDFRDKPLKERAEMLGYSYQENKDGSTEVSTLL